MKQAITELEIVLDTFTTNREVAEKENKTSDVEAYDEKIQSIREALAVLKVNSLVNSHITAMDEAVGECESLGVNPGWKALV